MPRTELIRPDLPLTGTVDAEARFDRFPSDFGVKGMFLSRMASLAPPHVLDRVRPKLVKAPSLGRYLPFADYPQVDYSRLTHAVATDLYRHVDVPEGMRRLARHDIQTFAASQVGKIMLALARDASGALMKLPEMYGAALRGGRVEAKSLEPRRISLRFTEFYGWLDCYPIGTVEGLAQHFGETCDIELKMDSELAATFVVTLR